MALLPNASLGFEGVQGRNTSALNTKQNIDIGTRCQHY
jgi:hypothetical protein